MSDHELSSQAENTAYGLMAEFASAAELAEAAHAVRAAGYRHVDAFMPYPSEHVTEALALPPSKMPLIVLLGGLCGGIGGYLLQFWSMTIEYPFNIGGRPYHSWPAFIVPTFECTILAAALSAVVGMIVLNGLPQPYHPVFNVERFARASSDRFFLLVESRDPKFDAGETRRFLAGLHAAEVSAVEP